MLRIFFKYKRRLLGNLCSAAVQALLKYLQATTGTELHPGIVAVIQTSKYMIRPLLSLERISFDEREGKICYQFGKSPEEVERGGVPRIPRRG